MNKIQIGLIIAFSLLGIVLKFILTGHDYLGYICFIFALLIPFFHYANKPVRIVAVCLIIIGLAVYSYFLIPVIKSSSTDAPSDCEYIIVLGAGLHGDVPSLSLVNRLEAAEAYLVANPDTIAVVTGGMGPGESITEAEAMGIWLEARGIASERIILETEATSTEENLRFSFEILESMGGVTGEIAIVSSEYHLHRAKLMAEAQGYNCYGVAGHTSYPTLMVNYFIREGLGMAYYTIFGGL